MISIIVTVYNTKQYLPACIDSILKQDYQDFEILLIDDGSEKDTADMCDRYAAADNRIRTYHQENRGIGGAKNSGLDHAEGEYILFIDSDDTIPENHLAILNDEIEKNNADIAIGSLTFVPGPIISHGKCVLNNRQLMEKLLYRNGIRDVSVSKLYKKKMFKGLRFTEKIYGEDFDLFYRLFSRAENAAVTDETTYYYYQYSFSFSNSGFSTGRFRRITVCEDLAKRIPEEYPELEPALHACLTDEAINLYTIAPEQYLEERQWALDTIEKYGKEVVRDTKAPKCLVRKIRMFMISPGLWKVRMKMKKVYITLKNRTNKE